MDNKNGSLKAFVNIALGLLFIIGIGLIVFVFFFIFGGNGDTRGPNATSWLNLIVILFMFAMTYVSFWALSKKAGENADVLPAHLSLGSFILFYDVAATAIIVASIIGLDFKFALIFQLVIAFVFALMFVLTLSAFNFAKTVAEGEAYEKESADKIKNEVRRMQLSFQNLGADFAPLQKLYDALSDDIKHITPNTSDEASGYDNDILKALEELKNLLDGSKDDREAFTKSVSEKITSLRNIVSARKKVYSR